MCKKKINVNTGDYVIGTLYSDGEPKDPWYIGFYVSSRVRGAVTKYLVADEHGNLFRSDGFRRIKKISRSEGNFLLANKERIEQSGRTLYWHLRTFQAVNASEKSEVEKNILKESLQMLKTIKNDLMRVTHFNNIAIGLEDQIVRARRLEKINQILLMSKELDSNSNPDNI